MQIEENHFEDGHDAAAAMAARVAVNLEEGIAARGKASLVVSGEAGLNLFFRALRVQALDWSKVQVTLVDECWVAIDSRHSHERRVRTHLLQANAAAASLVGLKTDDTRPIQAVVEMIERISALPRPFDAVVLDVGTDGHIAALFPDMPALGAMLNPGWAVQVGTAISPAAPQERVSMTLRALLDTHGIFLNIGGEAQAEICAAARAGNTAYPVAALLRQRNTPVCVFISRE